MCAAVSLTTKRPPSQRRQAGISVRHRRGCPAPQGACACRPAYQAMAWSAADRKPVRRTFASLAEAKAWRQETQVVLRKGTLRAPSARTLEEAAAEWMSAADAGVIRTRSGTPYKPSALRAYRGALRRVLPELGARKLSQISRPLLQDLIDAWVAQGASAGTVRNYLLPVQAIFRRALAREEVAVNPTKGLALPKSNGTRDRVAPPTEASALIAALPPHLQALWATAIYAGLRRGELQGLRWSDIDLERGLISVVRSWDETAGPIAPKSEAGRRRVPLAPTLRRHLIAHRLQQGAGGEGYVFASRAGTPFFSGAVTRRARRAWSAAGLPGITLHECRHTCASYMIAAGVNAKALSTYLGHSSITVTLDRYGHLLPGNEEEAATLLEGFLERAASAG
jgi:integrase